MRLFFKYYKAFFAFCNVILDVSNISCANGMQWMNKMWIKSGYNVEKYNVDELNFLWETNCFAIVVWFTTLQLQ